MNLDTRFNDPLFNHTAAGTFSSKLHPTIAQDGAVLDAIGPAINLSVSPGDTVRIKVFSLYGDTISDPSNVVPALLTVLVGSFGNASPAGEAVQLVDAFGAAFTAGAAIPTSDRQGAPKAYLQYIVFNKNMTMAQHGHIMVDPTQKGSWQKMEMEVPIEENGYIYIYVANESLDNVAVYFDDMEVQLIDAPTTNASDYYPFGLAMTGRSYSSEKYRFGYQGQFAELDEETGWNSFELRMYTSVIGRWMAVDPARQYYSAYLGMGNNPITRFDPDGRFDEPKNWFQRTWNSVTFRGGLNKHNSIKVHRVLSPSEIKQFDEMQLTGTLNGVKTFDGRGEFRKFGIFPSPPDGAGFEANFFIGPGGAISIDRIQDAAGGNDLYLSISGGGGADISADFHANYYTNGTNPKPQSIVGLSYFWSGGYGPTSFQKSSTIDFSSGRIGEYNLLSPGLGIGTPYLIGGGKVGLTYTINLSDVARTIQGYKTRSYHH